MIKANNSVEWAILGAMLSGKDCGELYAKIEAEDFSESLQPLAKCLFDSFSAGQPLDFVSVAERFSLDDQAPDYDWQSIGALVIDNFLPASVIPEYIRLIKQSAKRRKLQDVARTLLNSDMEPDAAAEYALSQLEADSKPSDTLFNLSSSSSAYLRGLQERLDHPGVNGIPTGFKDLDERYLGFKPGKFIIIAGRPSMGKSTLARNIGMFNAIAGKTVLLFSLEMTAADIAGCLVSSVGTIPGNHLLSARLTENEWPKVTGAISVMKESKFLIDEDSSMTLGRARARCYEVKRKCGLDLVMFDYLQLMDGPGQNRYEIVSELSRGMKKLASSLGIPVIALSQLSRSLESRQNKRPINSDLRESGQIEQDADTIIFTYRDKAYDENSPYGDVAELICSKFRGGSTGTDFLEFEGSYSRFKDLEYKFNRPIEKPKKAGKWEGMEV